MTTENDDLQWDIRIFAGEIVARVADDPIAQLGIIQASALLISGKAIEAADPAFAIEDAVSDIHAEATRMTQLVLAGLALRSDDQAGHPMEEIQ